MKRLLWYSFFTLLLPRKLHTTLTFICAALLFSTCKKANEENGGPVPGPLTNVTVETIADGAVISYSGPQDGIATSVVAEYVDDDGLIRTFTFDLAEHPGSITLNDGFSIKKGSRTVELYAISATGERSESVALEIEPLPPASIMYLNTVLESAKVGSTPTGFYFSFDNPGGNDLVFSLFLQDDHGEWELDGTYASGDVYDVFAIDHLFPSRARLQVIEAGEADFFSTMDYSIEPFNDAEVLLDKSDWSVEPLPNDAWQTFVPTTEIERLWDGNTGGIRFQSANVGFPQSFTIDLGENQSLGLIKMKVHCFGSGISSVYDYFHPKEYEIWGSNDPATDGSWTGWKKIRTCHSVKPSNTPMAGTTQEDYNYARAGEDFGFPEGTENYRYIRFKTLNVWNPHPSYPYIRLFELTLWGTE